MCGGCAASEDRAQGHHRGRRTRDGPSAGSHFGPLIGRAVEPVARVRRGGTGRDPGFWRGCGMRQPKGPDPRRRPARSACNPLSGRPRPSPPPPGRGPAPAGPDAGAPCRRGTAARPRCRRPSRRPGGSAARPPRPGRRPRRAGRRAGRCPAAPTPAARSRARCPRRGRSSGAVQRSSASAPVTRTQRLQQLAHRGVPGRADQVVRPARAPTPTGAEGPLGEITDVDVLQGQLPRPRREDRAAAGDPAQPPRQPADVLVRAEDQPGPDEQRPVPPNASTAASSPPRLSRA